MSNTDWLDQRLASMSINELHGWNAAINARIADRLQDPDYSTANPVYPVTANLDDYLASLGDGSRPYEGLSTGLDAIDHLIGGLNRFTLLAARAGTGKSTLAVQMALGAIQTEAIPVLYYSFEMPRKDIITMAMQNLRRGHEEKLTRTDIVLKGRAGFDTITTAISESATALREIGSLLYVVDATDGEPTTDRMAGDITQIKTATGATNVLVIIDSIQDLVKPGQAGATSAEADTAQKIVEIQMETDATFLAISQKAKGANLDDPYAAVLGSVSLIHKPTAVLELISVYDLLRAVKDPDALRNYRLLADTIDVPRPVIARVIKGRHNGSGHASLKFYGPHAYFETGQIPDYATGDYDLYNLNSFTN